MSVTIDELLQGSAKDGVAFDIQALNQHLNSEDYRTDQLKALAENHRDQKILRQQQFNILLALSDPAKRERLFNAVCAVHQNILEVQDETSVSVDTVIQHSFDKPEDASFLMENKHSKFYRSAEVLDVHNEHPVQKQMMKGKYLGRRTVKKQKTPMQHFNHLVEAKSKMTKDQRLEALENSMQETRQMMVLLASNQVELAEQLGETQKSLATLQDTVKDLRKLKLYVIIHNNKGKPLTTKQLAKSLDVSERTIKYWKKELRDEGYL